MLFLSRKWGESIVLKLPNGDVIRIEATEPRAGTRDEVKIGLEGPPDVVFLREELLSDKEFSDVEIKLDSYLADKKGRK